MDVLALELNDAGVFFDRDAWIVARGLTQTGQAVEKGAFPGVGIAYDGDRRPCASSNADPGYWDAGFSGFSHRRTSNRI